MQSFVLVYMIWKALNWRKCATTCVLVLYAFITQAQFNYRAVWKDNFTSSEKQKLTAWIDEVGAAVKQTIGTYAFPVTIYFHRKDNSYEPVPWAHTARDGEEAVHFHVDTRFSLQAFLEDWTAAHEIAHLSIPYIGKQYMWFSEGYASYLQWQIMHNQGLLSEAELQEKYRTKVSRTVPKYNNNEPFVSTVKSLHLRHDYPGLYYGGACFFIQLEQLLEKEGTTLAKTIAKYQTKGRLNDESIEELIDSLDQLVPRPTVKKLFNQFLTGTSKQTVYSTEVP